MQRLQATGGTDINLALLNALDMDEPGRPTLLLFLTDGLPTEGEVDTGNILNNAGAAAPENVRLFAFGVGDDVDAILLDSGNPNLEIKELGGTGRTHNWQLSRKIRESMSIPIFLAGGLKPENIRQAIEEVQPFGIDLCSGVRTNGKLDSEKLNRFMNEVHRR